VRAKRKTVVPLIARIVVAVVTAVVAARPESPSSLLIAVLPGQLFFLVFAVKCVRITVSATTATSAAASAAAAAAAADCRRRRRRRSDPSLATNGGFTRRGIVSPRHWIRNLAIIPSSPPAHPVYRSPTIHRLGRIVGECKSNLEAGRSHRRAYVRVCACVRATETVHTVGIGGGIRFRRILSRSPPIGGDQRNALRAPTRDSESVCGCRRSLCGAFSTKLLPSSFSHTPLPLPPLPERRGREGESRTVVRAASSAIASDKRSRFPSRILFREHRAPPPPTPLAFAASTI